MSASKVGVTKTLHLRVALLADNLADADEAFATLSERVTRATPEPQHSMFYGDAKNAKVIIRELTVTP